jgi:archaellum biogenesis ATPase FlaH
MIQTANQRVANGKTQSNTKLFGSLWYEGQLTILAGDTGIGKSILAYTIADAISRGQSRMKMEVECPPSKVLLFDMELEDVDISERYKDYDFHPNLLISTDRNITVEKIKELLNKSDAKIVIIDNITYLKYFYQGSETNKEKNLMLELDALKKEGISILVISHINKISDDKPLTLNCVSGNKNIVNFIDGLFFLGKSCHDKNIRYIKNGKERRHSNFDGDIVLYKKINENGFLTFDFIDYDEEINHLRCKVKVSKKVYQVDWDSVFDEEETMKQKDILDKLVFEYSMSKGSARNYIDADLERIKYGIYGRKTVDVDTLELPPPDNSGNTIKRIIQNFF